MTDNEILAELSNFSCYLASFDDSYSQEEINDSLALMLKFEFNDVS
tara:strand:+ start:97 stop:234 length:138 start_codon:yes stop_codon:yes gene_type:complete